MLEAHYDAYAKARELVASLAVGAPDGEAFSSYNAALLDIDGLNDDTDLVLVDDTTDLARDALYDEAVRAVDGLSEHGDDRLAVQLIVTQLEAGWTAEREEQASGQSA